MPSPLLRTRTTHLQTFTRPHPEAVTYDLSTANLATITLPAHSTWTSGLHWHESHTEYLHVKRGAAHIVLGNAVLPAVTSTDGPVTVPRGTLHEWRRSATAELETELVVVEWTEPADGLKEVFFRAVNGLVMDALRWAEEAEAEARAGAEAVVGSRNAEAAKGRVFARLEVELKLLFRRLDNYPAVVAAAWPMAVHRLATGAVLLWAVWYAWVFNVLTSAGYSGLHEEYVPSTLQSRLKDR